MKLIHYLYPILCLSSILGITGCGQSGPSAVDINHTNMLRLRAAYGIFQTANGMRGPQSEEEFKGFLKLNETARVKLLKMNVAPESVDEIFFSERDGEPFKIRYGVNGMADHPLIFESTGVNGKRFVAYNQPVELDKPQYLKCWEGKVVTGVAMDAIEK